MLKHVRIFALIFLFIATGCTKKNAADDSQDASGQDPAVEEVEEEAVEEAAADEVDDVQRETQRWFIFDEKVACGHDDTTECFRIRRAAHPEWEVLQGDIKGFEYEDGIRYILEVDVLTKGADSAAVDSPDDAGADSEGAGIPEDAEAADERIEVGYELKRQVSPLPPGEEEHTCTSHDDCEEGEMCTGPAGCDIPWTCARERPCTRDLRQYCSCEGKTIEGSGSCPPAPYRHPGPCKE